MQFSDQLIKEAQECFKEEDNIDISPETANEYLSSISNLFLAFSRINKSKKDNDIL